MCNYLYSRKDNKATESQDFFGLEAWNKLPEYVQSREGKRLDNRYARIFMEHRQLKGHRIKKLYELGYLSNAYFEEYNDKVCILAQAVHYLFIKYNLTCGFKEHCQIIESIKRANTNEAEIIGKIVEAVC